MIYLTLLGLIAPLALGKRFQLIRSHKTWDQAAADCRRRGGELATPDNSSENQQIRRMGGRPWIGPNDKRHERRFVKADGSKICYTYWQPGEPNNWGRGEDCTEMYSSGRWNDLPCNHRRYYVCEFRAKKSYTFHRSARSWDSARAYCRSQGGDLAKIETAAENAAVHRLIGANHAWISVNDKRHERRFVNADGSAVCYTNWYPGEPNNSRNEDCTEMYGRHGGRWNDLRCSTGRYFVCQGNRKCEWRPSGGCNKKCGGGKRKFMCGSKVKYVACNTQKCPVDCKWKPFGSYGKCSALCDGGYQTRTRGKTGPFHGGKACSGSSMQRKTCGNTPCYKVTNCGTLAQIYAKTKGKLLGEVAQAKKNLGAFNKELALAKDEVADGEKLLKLINTLPNSGAKNKIKALVEKCLREARAALAALQGKIKAENGKIKSATDKINKLEHSAAKCKCDAQARQLRPLVQRATQKIKDNRKEIDAIDKMLANLYALNRSFQMKINGFAWIKPFGGGLYEMMTKTFRDMIARTNLTINALKAKRKVLAAYNTQWGKKIEGYNKQMKDCSAKVAELAKKLKLLLEEFGMMDIWQEIAAEYDDLSYATVEEDEEEEETEAAVEEAETFTEEQHVESEDSSSSSSMQNVFAAVMVIGGLGAFVMGKRTTKYAQYESLL